MRKTTKRLLGFGIIVSIFIFSFLTSCSVDKEELDKKSNVHPSDINAKGEDILESETKVWHDHTAMASDYEGLDFEKKEGRVYRMIEIKLESDKGKTNFYTKVKSNDSGEFLFLEDLDGLILKEGEEKTYIIGGFGKEISVSSFSVSGLIRKAGFIFSGSGGIVTVTGYYYEEK